MDEETTMNSTDDNKPKPPFFILGFSRSGTTLFRHILNVHPNLAVVEEPHYWVKYYENIDLFGDLNNDVNLVRLLKSIFSTGRFKSHGLDIEIDNTLIEAINPRTYSRVIDVLFAKYAKQNGKPRWSVDNPSDIAKIPKVLELFPDAKFIFLIRDIRGVVGSSIQVLGNDDFNYYKFGQGWIEGIELFKKNVSNLPEDRWLIVRYEDLVSNPDSTLRLVCKFIDEPYSERLINYNEYALDDVAHTKSDSYLKKISTGSIDKWKKLITKRKELERLESIVGRYLEEFDYKPVTDYNNFKESSVNKTLYGIYKKTFTFFDLLAFLEIRGGKLRIRKKLGIYLCEYTHKLNTKFVKKMRIYFLK